MAQSELVRIIIFISVENLFLNVAHHCEYVCPARLGIQIPPNLKAYGSFLAVLYMHSYTVSMLFCALNRQNWPYS
jgi:hypothetical protein